MLTGEGWSPVQLALIQEQSERPGCRFTTATGSRKIPSPVGELDQLSCDAGTTSCSGRLNPILKTGLVSGMRFK